MNDTQVKWLDDPVQTIDSTWTKPKLIRSVFVASTGKRCQAEGTDGGDWRTNLRKNRVDAPAESHAIL
jgi:hypothetical protein